MRAGNLLWYRASGAGRHHEAAPNNGVVIGTGWEIFNRVIDGGNGVLYAIDRDGNLRWYKDTHRDGPPMDGHVPNRGGHHRHPAGGASPRSSPAGTGSLYAIDRDEQPPLVQGHAPGRDPDGRPPTPSFDVPNKGAMIGNGWGQFTTVISTGNGVIFGQDAVGDLWWHQDLAQDGTIRGLTHGRGEESRLRLLPRLVHRRLLRRGQCRRRRRDHAIDSTAELRFDRVREHAGSTPTLNK